jgi:tetratricopeptide (TPR) repeat protein
MSSLYDNLLINPNDISNILQSVADLTGISSDDLQLTIGDDINYNEENISSSQIYASILLQVLTLDILYEANDKVTLLYTGSYALKGVLSESEFEENKTYANFVWMYVAALSEHDEYMDAFFPPCYELLDNENSMTDAEHNINALTKVCNVTSRDVWSIAKSLRLEDVDFKTFVKNKLLKEDICFSGYCDMLMLEDFIKALNELNLNEILTEDEASDIASKIMTFIHENSEDIDYYYDKDDPTSIKQSPIFLNMIKELQWPLNEDIQNQLYVSVDPTSNYRRLRLLADAYVMLGRYKEAIQSYEKVIKLAEDDNTYSNEPPAVTKSTKNNNNNSYFGFSFEPSKSETDEDKCEEMSAYETAKMAHFGLGEAYAALYEIENSMNSFERVLNM